MGPSFTSMVFDWISFGLTFGISTICFLGFFVFLDWFIDKLVDTFDDDPNT